MTPGRPQLPRTPRLCFKENDNSRFGTHDFPSTPKFGRSESTPELHRIRKLDQSLHMLERNTTQEKAHYNNVLQESNASNLLTLTSDSLPDIFRKPISQQQHENDIFALKVVRLDSVDEVTAEGYINEIRLLKQLQGLPRVVRLLEYEYNEEEEKLLLVMEKGDTDFATVIRTRTSLNAINPTLIRFYWQEMLEAVKEIHDKNVIHTDLKPANFLLVNGGLKFIDFGIATSIQADMTSIMKDSQCGTYNYMTPEAIKSATPSGTYQEYKISRKTDVWSLGCMLYSLIYKNPPFNFPLKADPMVIAVLKGCLDRNPRTRPSIEQLLSHPYLTCTSQSPV
ncbi:hypothetical protein DAPPUDRAFT_321091 [Daphnia pulex]|uniref:Protein kinase domain-containing protein n=1 Tax=Daphnia pulex TaxID=6669 RepID=E9GRW2_DAPPU|nr:hypothetical protein DAPPUDRAFT_321091 [Daphnia pulex]|eukprot:EFX77847.1 hypothetical protein DAPPUDRAFT_321091 [Daphnia pulex]